MDVFISWSKERSMQVARAIKKLLDCTMEIRSVDEKDPNRPVENGRIAHFSEDLPKGGTWFDHLASKLENAHAGIICVTPENRTSPWLLFEAGALLRCDRKVRLFPVLLDLEPAVLDPPLSLLQSTILPRDPDLLEREIMDLLWQILEHLNKELEAQFTEEKTRYELTTRRKPLKSRPPEPTQRFVHFAPDPTSIDKVKVQISPVRAFADDIARIEPTRIDDILGNFTQLFDRKTFREPFEQCGDQRWLDRYAATMLTKYQLNEAYQMAMDALPAGTQRAYDGLRSSVDSYAMTLAGQLLDERDFSRNADGSLKDQDGRLAVSERRRRDIEARFLRFSDPVRPVFDDARVYEELSDLRERKIRLIHPMEQRFEAEAERDCGATGSIPAWQLEKAAVSTWLYDRLVYYIYARYFHASVSKEQLLAGLGRECKILESADKPQTLVGIYYALETIESRKKSDNFRDSELSDILGRITDVIARWRLPFETDEQNGPGPDANGKVRNIVERILGVDQ